MKIKKNSRIINYYYIFYPNNNLKIITTILIAINGRRATVRMECNRFRICIFGDIVAGDIVADCWPPKPPPPYGIFA